VELRVLHRDEALIAIDKPSGVFVHPTDLDRGAPALLAPVCELVGARVHPVHRLDRATSGVVLFAMGPEPARALQAALAEADKRYLALLRGRIDGLFTIDRPLGDLETGVKREARTTVSPLGPLADATWAEVRIEHGRQHQIRRHMNHAGHHVLGDTTYGKGAWNRRYREAYGLERLALHAASLAILHPASGVRLRIRAALPEDLRAPLARIEGWAALAETGDSGAGLPPTAV